MGLTISLKNATNEDARLTIVEVAGTDWVEYFPLAVGDPVASQARVVGMLRDSDQFHGRIVATFPDGTEAAIDFTGQHVDGRLAVQVATHAPAFAHFTDDLVDDGGETILLVTIAH